jgi:hypothetical protein
MANDIALAIAENPIKNGTLVLSCTVPGFFDVENSYVSNSPALLDIQAKYDNRFDDPSYYHGTGSVDGGDVGI